MLMFTFLKSDLRFFRKNPSNIPYGKRDVVYALFTGNEIDKQVVYKSDVK